MSRSDLVILCDALDKVEVYNPQNLGSRTLPIHLPTLYGTYILFYFPAYLPSAKWLVRVGFGRQADGVLGVGGGTALVVCHQH